MLVIILCMLSFRKNREPDSIHLCVDDYHGCTASGKVLSTGFLPGPFELKENNYHVSKSDAVVCFERAYQNSPPPVWGTEV